MPKNSLPKASVDWWTSVCRKPSPARLSNATAYCQAQPLSTASPVDDFLLEVKGIITAGTPANLQINAKIGPLFILALLSATENYFRNVFSRALLVCPISQVKSAGRDVKLGSVVWYRTGVIERGAFEGFSFASEENLKDTCKRYFDFQIGQSNDCHPLLQEFEKLCEMRHAIVHSACVLSGKNSLKLQLQKSQHDTVLRVGFNELQEAAEVCVALVTAFNSDFFKLLAQRWNKDWGRLIPGWNNKLSNKYFKDLWQLFFSTVDAQGNNISTKLSMTQCKKAVLNS